MAPTPSPGRLIRSSFAAAPIAAALLFSRGIAFATTHSLNTAGSPFSVVIDDPTGRITVTDKASSGGTAVWTQGDSVGGGDAWVFTTGTSMVSQMGLTITYTDVKINGYPVNVVFFLAQTAVYTGAPTYSLKVTISGNPGNTESIPNNIQYPYAFFNTAAGASAGYAVLPYLSGFVVPTTDYKWPINPTENHNLTPIFKGQRMEWFGGTDSAMSEGWMCIADPAADMLLDTFDTTVGGNPELGGVFSWLGSNNGTTTPNQFAYSRAATYTFFTSGGYVALAKNFRAFAKFKGWFKSLVDKAAQNSKVDNIIGAPVIYLWGDGRSDTMLAAMSAAGISKALIQVSVNSTDQNGFFPNQTSSGNSGWASDVRKYGYTPGAYDIYQAYNSTITTPPTPYNGYIDLWASGGAGANASTTTWSYYSTTSSRLVSGNPAKIAQNKAASFALNTRLPERFNTFGFDALFFDTTCADGPYEDYDSLNGHVISRSTDITDRISLLQASSGPTSSSDFNKLTGVEFAQSWGMPNVHWVEGIFQNGNWGWRGNPMTVLLGKFDNVAYPSLMVDVLDPFAGPPMIKPAELLSTGYRAPLFELVFHDSVLNVQHWDVPHNKLLYAWDLSDLNAMLRGQTANLNLVYNDAVGSVGTNIVGATDSTGTAWDARWTTSSTPRRVLQTFNTVCTWNEIVGDLEMINHAYLTTDRSVQNTEFSGDGGSTGHGIVVNFGVYPGTGNFMSGGSTWTGTIRGTPLSVPINSTGTYSW